MNLMDGLYKRVELTNAMITPNEVLLLIRDFHRRLKELENVGKEKPAANRRGADKVSKPKVPSS